MRAAFVSPAMSAEYAELPESDSSLTRMLYVPCSSSPFSPRSAAEVDLSLKSEISSSTRNPTRGVPPSTLPCKPVRSHPGIRRAAASIAAATALLYIEKFTVFIAVCGQFILYIRVSGASRLHHGAHRVASGLQISITIPRTRQLTRCCVIL